MAVILDVTEKRVVGSQPPQGYIAWHEWAAVQHKAGLRQKQCGQCGLWKYPQEMSRQQIVFTLQRRDGLPLTKEMPLCLECFRVAPNKGL